MGLSLMWWVWWGSRLGRLVRVASGGFGVLATVVLRFFLVLYYFYMYLCDDDICTDADIDEAVASDDIIENIMDNFITINSDSGVASYSLTDDDLELVAESM